MDEKSKLLALKILQLSFLKKAEILSKVNIDELKNSHILLFPVKINGKSSPAPDQPDYHITLKWLGNNTPKSHEEVQSIVDKYNVHPPEITHIQPDAWVSKRDGNIHHVLKLKGNFENLTNAHDDLSEDNPSLWPYTAHISIPKEMHDSIKSGDIDPSTLDIKVGPLEYRVGEKRVKSFVPRLAASELAKGLVKQSAIDSGMRPDLIKAPMEAPQEHLGQHKVSHPHNMEYINTINVAPNVYQHIYQNGKSFTHVLSSSKNKDRGNNYAELSGSLVRHPETKETLLRVHNAHTDPSHAGKGYGKILYGQAAKYHGGLVSDRIVSPQARKAYESFQDHPDYEVKIGQIKYDDPTQDDIDEEGFERANYGTPHYLRYKPANQQKLAASEFDNHDLEKVAPEYEGQIHPDPEKPWVAKINPDNKTVMWHANAAQTKNIDETINDPNLIQNLISKVPDTHKPAMKWLINRTQKDDKRHFIPSEDTNKQQLRARHLKSLLLGSKDVTIDTSDPESLKIIRNSHSQGREYPPIVLTYKFAGGNKNGVRKAEANEFRGVNEHIHFVQLWPRFEHDLYDGGSGLHNDQVTAPTFEQAHSANNRNTRSLEKSEKDLKLDEAKEEIDEKTLSEIQKETALKWAARSVAAYEKYKETGDKQWEIDAEEYRHEAVEHAALINDEHPDVLQDVHDILEKYRKKAGAETISKSEKLQKMGAARRLYGNFDSKKELGEEGRKNMDRWIGGNMDETSVGRNGTVIDPRAALPEPSEGAKLRMMNKLSNRATHRFNTKSGQREFLLHRQMSDWEYKDSVFENTINHHKTHSSWTPHLSSIKDSSGIYSRDSFSPEDRQSYNHIVSAWVPESHIKSFVPQYGAAARGDKNGASSGTMSKEQEVIVRPNHNSNIHEIHRDTGADPKQWKWEKVNKSELKKTDFVLDDLKSNPHEDQDKKDYIDTWKMLKQKLEAPIIQEDEDVLDIPWSEVIKASTHRWDEE